MNRQSLAFGLLLACLSSFLHAKGARKDFNLYDFSKGVDTYHDPTTLPDGYVQDSLNVLFDDIAPVTKRAGYTVGWSTTTSYAFTGLWTYTDETNVSWQIARSSTNIIASNMTGTIVQIATVSAANIVGETNAFGNAYFVDHTQGVYYWNGTSTTFVGASSPRGSIITQFHNRIWITGAAVPNGNQLYGSSYYSGNTWTTGINATDPVQFSVGLQDNFDNNTAIYVYLDTLYLFKHYSTFALYGFDQTNFQISQLTQECGCIDGGSIQTYNGGLKFVSLRGVEDFNGYTCKRISDAVKNKVDQAIQLGSFSQQSWIQSTVGDWNAGTLFNLNTAASAPSLVLSTFSATDTSNANFSQGTLTNTIVYNGVSVKISTNNTGSINDPDFEGTFSTNFAGGASFDVSETYTGDCTILPQSGTKFLRVGQAGAGAISTTGETYGVKLLDSSGNILETKTSVASDRACAWIQETFTPSSSYKGTRVKFVFFQTRTSGGSTAIVVATTTASYIFGGSISYYSTCAKNNSPSTYFACAFDNVSSGSSTIDSGQFTSRTFDTLITSNTTMFNANWTVNTSTPYVELQDSSDSSTWRKVTSSTGTNSATNRYIRYLSSFTVGSTEDALSTLDDASVTSTASSGTFKSAIHNTGPMGSWGNFHVSEVLNGGAITFSVCSSTNSNMGAPASCKNQTINSQITNTTGTYVQWFATFTVTVATQVPTLNSGTVQWFIGGNAVPMSSTVWDNRYWLSLTTTTADSVNDAVLVLNQHGAWAPFSIHAGAFTQYKGSLYHADSLGSGNVYLDNQAYTDNLASISSYIKTKNLSLGSLAADDYLYAIYPSAANSGNCSMDVNYVMDKSTTTFSLGSLTLNEFASVSSVKLPFPIDSSHQDFGQSVSFAIGTYDASCAWKFYGLMGLYNTRPIQ